jgi:uncharacterized 2Fe-2S/4Fe-4S cluster protein (DUF4445 family)
MNPQISYGEDIVSRIAHAVKSPSGHNMLQDVVIEALNRLIADLCAEISATKQEVFDAVIVGNAAMHHLLLGLPVRQLASAPFVPAVSADLDIKAGTSTCTLLRERISTSSPISQHLSGLTTLPC